MEAAGKIFLGEEDYEEKMTHMVRPLLDRERKCWYISSFDGSRIFYESYQHPQEKAVIVMSHGFCEFTKKFEEVIFYFFQEGYSVYIPDHRGHGYSQRNIGDRGKVLINSYEEYVEDFHTLITEIILKDKIHKKLVLYAHSMGGAIAALYLEQYPEIFSCAILSSPMLDINFGKIPAFIVRFVLLFKRLIGSETDYVPGHGPFRKVPEYETSSCLSKARYLDIFSKRLQDENYQTYGATCAWTLASLRAVEQLHRNAKLVKTPILLFQAGKDTTVKPEGQKTFASKSQNTELLHIPDSRHEIYNADTRIRREYYEAIFKYIKDH